MLANSTSPLFFLWIWLFSVLWLKPWVKSFTISCNWFRALLSDLLLFSFLLLSPHLDNHCSNHSFIHRRPLIWKQSSGDPGCVWCWQRLISYICRSLCVKSVYLGRKYGLNRCFWAIELVNRSNLPHLLVNRVRSGSLASTGVFCSLVVFWKTLCCCYVTSWLLWLETLFVMCAFV